MITVFSRNYYGGAGAGCTYSGYSALFDGVNQYANGDQNVHWPNIGTFGNPNKVIVSMWVKNNNTASQNGLKFMMSQNSQATAGAGNANDQFFRLAYEMNNGSGSANNRLYVTYRGDTTSNQIEKQYELHGNSAITGSTSRFDQWLDGNTTGSGGNIITNANDFVHLCVVMDLPPDGISYGIAGNIDTYWNGQLLTAIVNTASGSGTASGQGYGTLGVNRANLIGYWNGHIDEMLTTEDALNGMTTTFMNSHGLNSSQDIANFLWNSGCPGDTSHPQSAQWDYFTYRFENNWNSENTSPYPFSPVNGAGFSTTHA